MRRSIAQNKAFLIIYTIIAVAAYAAIALLIMHLVAHSGVFSIGTDTMFHIYRGEMLYENIPKGNWYPLYDPNWFNGVEIMRYWPPLGAYLYVLCELFAKAFLPYTYFGGYYALCGMIFFGGAIVWHIIGLIMKRPIIGSFLGIIWFFLPHNLFVLFLEGNINRSVDAIFLPLFIFAVYQYLNTGKTRYLPVITISFALIAYCHVGYAGMMALSLLLYLLIDLLCLKRYVRAFRVLLSTLLGYAMSGLYLVPSLIGGIKSIHTNEYSRTYFADLLITLNPFFRVENGPGNAYLGLATVILALLGVLFSYRRSRPGFWVGLILLLSTSDALYDVIMKLPLSSWLWMFRFVSIGLCFILMSFMMWKTLRRPLIFVMVLLLIADTIPSLPFLYGDGSDFRPEEYYARFSDNTLMGRAKAITEQRMCLLDDGRLESRGAYYTISGPDGGVKASMGVGREAAETHINSLNLGKAMLGEAYVYAFDRAIELGNDTVLMDVSKLKEHVEEIDQAAKITGFTLDTKNENYRLYKLAKDHPHEWGVISKYEALGIGTGSDIIAMMFPYIKEGTSNVLDEYTFEELSKYKLIYLSSFEFKDRAYAEELIVRLSEAGTKILISADGVPEDRAVNGRVFLDVLCNDITFSQGFPLLDTIDGTLDTDLFPAEYREWRTCFCDGLDHVWGRVRDENYDISFLGTKKNDNIVFVGLNLTFYYGQTRDAGVKKLLSRIMSLSPTDLPKREIVPIEIQYEPNKITITSDYDNVNTTLAYHNFFNLDKSQYEDNHLLYVPKGVTEIYLEYPYFVQGLLCTVVSGLLALIYHVVIHVMNRRRRKRAALGLDEAEVVNVAEPDEDEVVKDSYERLTEEEFERADAAYSFFNEKPIAEDTEVEDYGTDLEFEEVDIESYDYDMDYNNTEDDEYDDHDDYNIKE